MSGIGSAPWGSGVTEVVVTGELVTEGDLGIDNSIGNGGGGGGWR